MQLNEHKPNQTNQTVYCSSSKYADFNKLDYRLKDRNFLEKLSMLSECMLPNFLKT